MTSMHRKKLDVDEMLQIVGEFGLFQKMVNFIFCIMMFPSCFPTLISYFTVQNPAWKCSLNSTVCANKTTTFKPTNTTRCSPNMQRTDWEYVTSKSFSIVTEFDLVCEKESLIQLQTSALFLGFLLGALIIGWCADNYGRRKVLFTSLAIVITVGFGSVFVGNIYAFIVCRFVIGFFLHGTFPQLYILISEIVGNRYRAFANNVTFLSLGIALCVLALKAYLIPNWKMLFIICTVPYAFLLFFVKFIPESVRFYRVKGKINEAMSVFQRIAYWNRKVIPDDITIGPVPVQNQRSSPVDLLRTKKLARITCVVCWSKFAGATSFYCLYYTAGKISGHMYIDFLLITVLDIPCSMILTPFLNRYGRKKCSMLFMGLAAASCLCLGFTPNRGKLKFLRIFLGMLGKTCCVLSGIALVTWRIELFPTAVRGEAGGLSQLTNKVGATCSPWIDAWLSKLYPGGVFLFVSGLMFTIVLFQSLLLETKGLNIADTTEGTDQDNDTRKDFTSTENVENSVGNVDCIEVS